MRNVLAKLGLVIFLVAAGTGPSSAQRLFTLSAPNSTVASSTTTTTSATALTVPSPAPRNMVVRVYNAGAAVVVINFGSSSGVTTATTTGLPVAAGGTFAFTVPEGTTHCATIITTGTATVYFTVGEGII